jgi:tetratricopeptide (TPR) repeat protein
MKSSITAILVVFLGSFAYGQTKPPAQQPVTQDFISITLEEELLKAVQSYQEGRYTDAIGILRRYVEKDPGNKEAYILLGKSYVYSKDCTEALNVFKKIEPVLERRDKDVVYVDMARCYIQDRRYKEAKEYLNSIKDSTTDKDGINYLMATLNIAMQNYGEAKPVLISLFEASSVYKTRAAYYLSVIYQKENDLDNTMKYLEVAAGDKESEEGREAGRIMANISADRGKLQKKSSLNPFFRFRNNFVIDSNVPEMADVDNENLKYLTNMGSVSMRWGARADLELSGGVNFKKKNHNASAKIMYFTDYHFLPVNSMIPRSEFDANYYDIMFVYAGLSYNYAFSLNKSSVISPGLEIGVLNLFTDQFGSFVHNEGAKGGPNFYLTSTTIVPNVTYTLSNVFLVKPYYRLRIDSYHQNIEDGSLNSQAGNDNAIGLEGVLSFLDTDSLLFRFEYDSDDTDGRQWRYSGYRAGLGVSLVAFSVLDLRLVGEYFKRDFSDSEYTLKDGSSVARSDDRLSLSMGPEFILGKSGRIGLKYNFIWNKSNVDVYDYMRHIGMFFWELKF